MTALSPTSRRVWAGLLLLLAAFLFLAGCATGREDTSDLPWNTPQPWEGAPFIPGLESQ